jgi:hypothetical protein
MRTSLCCCFVHPGTRGRAGRTTIAVLLDLGPLAAALARCTIGPASLCGLTAFLVDVYLY